MWANTVMSLCGLITAVVLLTKLFKYSRQLLEAMTEFLKALEKFVRQCRRTRRALRQTADTDNAAIQVAPSSRITPATSQASDSVPHTKRGRRSRAVLASRADSSK
jgi:hypothetical protein